MLGEHPLYGRDNGCAPVKRNRAAVGRRKAPDVVKAARFEWRITWRRPLRFQKLLCQKLGRVGRKVRRLRRYGMEFAHQKEPLSGNHRRPFVVIQLSREAFGCANKTRVIAL